jgi:hypothetical protein
MKTSRVELHQVLLKLEKSMPAMIAKYPDDAQFMSAFVREADAITSSADPADHAWIHGQVGCILDEYGKSQQGYPRTFS